MNRAIFILLTIIPGLVLTIGCAPATFTGTWDYTVRDLPQGTITGQLIIAAKETESGGYDCHVISSDGMADFDMEDCIIVESVFTGFYYDQGSRIDVSGTFEGNTLKGFVTAQGTEFPLELRKEEE